MTLISLFCTTHTVKLRAFRWCRLVYISVSYQIVHVSIESLFGFVSGTDENFDFIVINDDLEEAYSNLKTFLETNVLVPHI